MTVKDLIQELEKHPKDMEVCIADYRKSLFNYDDDGSGIGIEPVFTVEINDSGDETFLALSFDNDDYDEAGSPDEGSAIYSFIINTVSKD